MSLSPPTLSAIQQAGQTLHAARQAVFGEIQENAQQMVATVANHPFSPESDKAYAQLRTVARLAHELKAMEEQLEVLYTSASEMMAPATPVLTALPGHVRRSRSLSADAHQNTENAEDAEYTDATTSKTAPSSKLKIRKATSKKPVHTGSNDEKVLSYLKTVLDRRSWKSLTQLTIAGGSGIPLGSVGLALRRLAAAGLLREGSKGAYRL
ncbi:MAG: hypothetical protein ABIQ90_02995 [Polaromonas sp.]